MRTAFSGLAVLALAAASVSAAVAQTGSNVAMAGCTMPMSGSHMMPKCSAAAGPVVWYVAASKKYYLKGSAQYGKGKGVYVCRATAVAHGGKPGPTGSMGGAMGHGAMGGAMPPARTMIPRPMGSPGSMGAGGTGNGSMASPMPMASPTPAVGVPGGTNAAPGSRSPNPTASGSLTGASGNQGNTGAPGAGGQVPNNPASSSNSSPSPRPSMRP
jgi:hypothetical protein